MMEHLLSTTQTFLEGTCGKTTSRVDTDEGGCYTKPTCTPDMFNFLEDQQMDQLHATLSALIDELHYAVSIGDDCAQIVEQIHQLNEAL